MASARGGKDSFALAYYGDIEVATVLTGFNATGVWRYDGRTSTAWESANWLDGDGDQVTDFPVGYIPSDNISLLIADLVGSPLTTGPTSQVTFNLRTIDDGYHAAALANFIHFANTTYSGMSLVRLDKWKGAALDGEWNTPGNWESWNGSAFIPLLANDTVPAQDGSPWTHDLLWTGTPTSSFTTRSAAYGPNPVRNVLVEASWAGGKILPSQGEGDTPITVIGTLLTYAAVNITTQSIPFATDIHAAGCTFEPGAVNPVQLWVGGYTFDDTGMSVSLMASGISVMHGWTGLIVEATTDPPAAGDVRRGVTFENDTKAGTMVPVRRAN
jgi:hypothetical protein